MPRRTPPPTPALEPEPVPEPVPEPQYLVHELDSNARDALLLLDKQIERLTDAIKLLSWIIAEAGELWLPASFCDGALLPTNLQRVAQALDTPAAFIQPALLKARRGTTPPAGPDLFDSAEGQG